MRKTLSVDLSMKPQRGLRLLDGASSRRSVEKDSAVADDGLGSFREDGVDEDDADEPVPIGSAVPSA